VLSQLPVLLPSAATARCPLTPWPDGFPRQALAKWRQVEWPASTTPRVPRALAMAWGKGFGGQQRTAGASCGSAERHPLHRQWASTVHLSWFPWLLSPRMQANGSF